MTQPLPQLASGVLAISQGPRGFPTRATVLAAQVPTASTQPRVGWTKATGLEQSLNTTGVTQVAVTVKGSTF